MQQVSQKIGNITEILKGLQGAINENYHAEIIGIFGSYSRNEQKEESDIDILVRFFEDATLFDFAELAEFLEEQLHLKVDLVSEGALREEIKVPILQEVVYV
jgi:predicted nucleotidyltransferase